MRQNPQVFYQCMSSVSEQSGSAIPHCSRICKKAIIGSLLAGILFIFAPMPCTFPATASAAEISVAFSPDGKSQELVLKAINDAVMDIRVAAYIFSSKPIAKALVEASMRGIDVKVIADEKVNSDGKKTVVNYLAKSGVPTRLNGKYANFHHKFMVIDGKKVETGSFNYSSTAAKKNAENVLYLVDVPELAEQYLKEWNRLWDESSDVVPSY